jgi:ribonuclease PH
LERNKKNNDGSNKDNPRCRIPRQPSLQDSTNGGDGGATTTTTRRDELISRIQSEQRDSGSLRHVTVSAVSTTATDMDVEEMDHDNSQHKNIRTGRTRNNRSLRSVRIETNVFSSSSSSTRNGEEDTCSFGADTGGGGGHVVGSSTVTMGGTEVLCQVIGPITASSPLLEHYNGLNAATFRMDDGGILYVDVTYLPHVGYPYRRTAMIETTSTSTSTTNNNNNNSSTDHGTFVPTSRNFMGHTSAYISGREYELSSQVLTALCASVPLDSIQRYNKTAIVVKIIIFQDDGSILPACIMSASIALVDATIELYDIVTACTVAVIKKQNEQTKKNDGTSSSDNNSKSKDIDVDMDHRRKKMITNDTFNKTTTTTYDDYLYLVDPTYAEMEIADAIVTVASMSSWDDEITYWEQQQQQQQQPNTGTIMTTDKYGTSNTAIVMITPEVSNTAMELCIDGCHTMDQLIRKQFLDNTNRNIKK